MFNHHKKTALYLAQGTYGKAVASILADDIDTIIDIEETIYAASLPYADFGLKDKKSW